MLIEDPKHIINLEKNNNSFQIGLCLAVLRLTPNKNIPYDPFKFFQKWLEHYKNLGIDQIEVYFVRETLNKKILNLLERNEVNMFFFFKNKGETVFSPYHFQITIFLIKI